MPSKTQIGNFKVAIALYVEDNGRPTTTAQGLQALLEPPTVEPRPRNWRGRT